MAKMNEHTATAAVSGHPPMRVVKKYQPFCSITWKKFMSR